MRAFIIGWGLFLSFQAFADLEGVRRVHREGRASNYAAQSIADMIRSGVVSQFSLDPVDNAREPNQSFDLATDDELTRALVTIEQRASARLEKDLAGLLARRSWSAGDRDAWESTLTAAVLEERLRVPGLHSYRSVANRHHRAETRPLDLHALARDIRDGTEKVEFDCEQMTAVDGIILQRIEDRLLGKGGTGLKTATAYMRVTGYIYMEFDTFNGVKDESLGGHHVFLVSPHSGNIIEATADPKAGEEVYRRPLAAWSLSAYLAGAYALVHAEKKFILYTSLPERGAAASIVARAKLPRYLESIPKITGAATAELAKLENASGAYAADPRLTELMAILAARGDALSAEDRAQLSRGLRALRPSQDAIAEIHRLYRYRLDNLRYLHGRLPADVPEKNAVATRLAEISEAAARSLEVLFDIESVSAAEPGFLLKELLSGKRRLRLPAGGYDGKVPSARAVSASESLGVK